MIGLVRSLATNRGGNAAVEMALVVPLLLVLMLGAIDVGNYYMSEHALDKAVRDAARFAARLPLADYPSCTVPSGGTAEQQTQRIARFEDPSGVGTARLPGWTADSMATLTIACDTSDTWAAGGIYTDFPSGAPVVTVQATVPYSSLFGVIGLGKITLNLNAQSQAAVIGA